MLIFNNKSKKGIGYQALIKLIMYKENILRTKIESKEHPRYTLYFGRMHLYDFNTNIEAIGPLKIGKSYVPTSLMRGRNEAGGEFRIYSEILLYDENTLDVCEKIAHDLLKSKLVYGQEGQKELFNISDHEIEETVKSVMLKISSPKSVIEKGFNIKEATMYENDIPRSIPINVPHFELETFIRFAPDNV